jgi:hypothetical protein
MTQPAQPATQAVAPTGTPAQATPPAAPAPTPPAATPAAPAAPATQATPPAPPAPPWGDDANFDPQKAWNLVQNLRSEIDELKPFKQQVKAIEDANKTESQRLAEERDAALKTAADRNAELLRTRVARKFGISEADEALFLTATDEATLTAVAEALAARNPAATPPPPVNPTTPVAALRPGALPSPPPLSLPEQIAAAEAAKDWTLARQLKMQQLQALAQQ